MIYPRKEAKSYGTGAEIEGGFGAGERVVVIDDLATTGGSKFEAIEKLTGVGLVVKDVVVLVDKDRVKAGRYAIEKFGCDTLLLDDGFQYWKLRGRRHDVVDGRDVVNT